MKDVIINRIRKFFGTDAPQTAPLCEKEGDEVTWKKWLDSKGSALNENDLVRIIEEPRVRNVFKLWAITILFAHDKSALYVEWPKDVYGTCPSFKKGLSGTFTEKHLLGFAADIFTFNTIARRKKSNYTDSMLEQEISYTLKFLQVLGHGNIWSDLFNLIPLNDRTPHSGMDSLSGYNPFSKILFSKVSIVWKIEADRRMREIIIAEQTGAAKPRVEWEDALKCYIGIINLANYQKESCYEPFLLASQIDFITKLDLSKHQDRLFSHENLFYLYTRIKGVSGITDFLRNFARIHILSKPTAEWRKFDLDGEERQHFADAVLADFGETDAELRNEIHRLKKENVAAQSARTQKVQTEHNHEESTLRLLF